MRLVDAFRYVPFATVCALSTNFVVRFSNQYHSYMRLISYATVLLALMSAFAAQAEDVTVGNFRYEIVTFVGSDEPEAVITGLADGFEPAGMLYFPTTVSLEGKEVKVTGLGWSNHSGHEGDIPVIGGFDNITSVRIPKYMRFIGRIEFKNCHSIEGYEVESGSETYTTINGSLVELSKSGSDTYRRLLRYPSGATATQFVVPADIDFISFGAFAANRHLKKIFLIGRQTLLECWQYNNRSIEAVDCTNSSQYSTDSDGAILYGPIFEGLCPGRIYGKYTVPERCKFLSSGAFCSSQVEEVVFPASVSDQGAGGDMFLESEVRKVTFLGDVPSRIWPGAFMGCRNLESITLGATDGGVLDIHTCAFKDCVSLESVTFASNTKDISIYTRAFEGCRSLASFPLTSSMKIRSLSHREFAGCESLTSFPFGCVRDIDTRQGYIFAGSGLKTVHWPSGFKSVPRGCFADCRQLEKVYLKDTTTDLYEDAFARSVIVGLNMMGVNWWSRSAFAGCPSLIRLYFPDNGAQVRYQTVDFITDSPQIVVNNPKISWLEEQEECPGVASLYISMVNGGVTVGNGWRTVYVPGGAAELYRQLTSSDVEEMFSYETDPSGTSVRIQPLVTGVKMVSVIINGETAVYSGGWYSVGTPSEGGAMEVTLNYTVFGNAMTSSYSGIYSGINNIDASDSAAGVWFTLSGLRLPGKPVQPGIYIRRSGTMAKKTIVR